MYFVSRLNRTLWLALLGGLMYVGNARAALLVIDNFELPDPAFVLPTFPGDPPVVIQQSPGSGVLGGQRDIRLVTDAGVGGAAWFAMGSDFGKASFDANTAAQRTTLVHLQYDGNDAEAGLVLNDGLGLLVDLTDGGNNNEFLIRFSNSQVPGNNLLNLFVRVVSSSGTSTFSGTKANNPINGSTVEVVDYYIPFASFSGGADFTQVQSITFMFNDDGAGNGQVGADFELSLLATVPEPGTALLLACGVVVGIGYGRRRRATR